MIAVPAKMWIAVLLLASAAARAQTLAVPRLGFVQNGPRELRPVYGVAGNFLIGPATAANIITVAFGGSFGLLKTASSVSAFDCKGEILASMGAASGPALFAFSPNGLTGLAYIESSKSLLEWRGGSFAALPLPFETGVVVALAFPASSQASLIVQRDESIWQIDIPIDATGAASERALTGVHAPLLLLPSGDIVYRDPAGIVIRRIDASEVHMAASLPKMFSLHQMNREWVQVTDSTSSAGIAIRTTPGREALYRLPK